MLRRLLPCTACLLAAALALAHVVTGQESRQRLRVAIPGDDGSLTPYTFESGYAFMSLVYDTLTWRDADGKPQPWLARSITRDGTGGVVTVRLRQDVKWHDGRPLTAADVVFTYRFMAERPHPRFTPQLQDIARVDATTPTVVRFTMRRRALGIEDQPFADVPILPQHLWNGLPRNRRAPPGRPVGTGPYRLTSHQPGRSYRFDANRDYFRGTPSIGRIDAPVIRREASIVDELRRRQIDAAPVTIPPGTSSLPIAAGFRVSDDVSYNGTMLLFNVEGRPFDRLAARQAVARSLDLDAIAGNPTGIAGGVVAADRGMLHPRSPWARAGVLHRFDPDAARLAFAEQGIAEFRVAAPRNDPVRLVTGERVVRALRRLGARARLVELAPDALDQALGRRRAPASFDVAVLGIPALASYDPAFLRVIFGDPHVASLNDGGYRSDAFDALAERSASAQTVQERRDVVAQQLRLLARELPAVPLLFGGGAIVYRPTAYDRWVAVRGAGILDKRSFLRGPAPQPAAGTRSAAPTNLTDASDDQGFSLVPVIIGFIVLVLAGCLWWLRRGRR